MKAIVAIPGFVWASFLGVVSGALCVGHSRMELVCLWPQLEDRAARLMLSGVWGDDGTTGSLVGRMQFIICL